MARIGNKRKEEIRNKIIEVSKKLFFEQGYDKTSTNQIAKNVGIAEGTIFNYFNTKAEIFLEIFTNNFFTDDSNFPNFIDKELGVADIIYNFLYKHMKPLLVLPKLILKELAIACLSIMKKNPMLMKKLAELDYQLLEKLDNLIIELQKLNLIIDCNTTYLSENIYSVVLFEILIFVYEDEKNKEDMLNKMKEKIAFALKGYTTG